MSTTSKLIRLTRQATGITIADLAARTGRSEAHLNQIETGMLHGTPETLLAVADALDISPLVLRQAYVQDATDDAIRAWNYAPKCKGKCKTLTE